MVITIGETMVLLVPPSGRLEHADTLEVTLAGAESTVAAYLAGLGHRAIWRTRLGDDPWGRRITAELERRNVRVDADLDAARPTAVFFKDPSPDATQVHYYRAGSAASAMSSAFLDATHVPAGTSILHTSGINAALGSEPLAMCRALRAFADRHRLRWSFDVNYRPGLWSVAEAAPVLLELARQADLVFVGRDEAEALWGSAAPRDLIPDCELVVKDGEVGATAFEGGRDTFVATPSVDVVEVVGAGDAFAAGYLAGELRGLPAAERLLLGHRTAALALGVTGDMADPEQITALRDELPAQEVPAPEGEDR